MTISCAVKSRCNGQFVVMVTPMWQFFFFLHTVLDKFCLCTSIIHLPRHLFSLFENGLDHLVQMYVCHHSIQSRSDLDIFSHPFTPLVAVWHLHCDPSCQHGSNRCLIAAQSPSHIQGPIQELFLWCVPHTTKSSGSTKQGHPCSHILFAGCCLDHAIWRHFQEGQPCRWVWCSTVAGIL